MSTVTDAVSLSIKKSMNQSVNPYLDTNGQSGKKAYKNVRVFI